MRNIIYMNGDVVKAVINGELVRAREMLNELIGDDE